MVIKNIVLSGGQIKGISYIGILRALEDLDLLNNIENILGVSSGAIMSFAIALGLSSKQIEKILDVLTLDNLRDISSDNIFKFNETYGFDTCNSFCKIFKVITKKILGNENATFKNLKENRPNINLQIAGANITQRRVDIFSYENTPDMPLWLAVRISMSVPIYFTKICYNGNCYVDGAILNNYPIELYENDLENTIGIILTDPDNIDTIDSIGVYMYKIMDCVMGVLQNHLKQKYKKNTFEIFIKYNLLEFRFDKEIKKYMISEGYNQFMKLYKNKYGNSDDNNSVSTNTDSIDEKKLDDVINIIKNEIVIDENIIDIEKIVNTS